MEDNKSFAEVLTGKGHEKNVDLAKGDTLGIPENHPLRKVADFGKKILGPLSGNHAGGDHGIFPSQEQEPVSVIPLSWVKEMLNSIKKEVDSWLRRVDICMGLSGPGPERDKPITILKRPNTRTNMKLSLDNLDGVVGNLDRVVGITHPIFNGRGKSPSVGSVEVVQRKSLEYVLGAKRPVEVGEVANR